MLEARQEIPRPFCVSLYCSLLVVCTRCVRVCGRQGIYLIFTTRFNSGRYFGAQLQLRKSLSLKCQ